MVFAINMDLEEFLRKNTIECEFFKGRFSLEQCRLNQQRERSRYSIDSTERLEEVKAKLPNTHCFSCSRFSLAV